MRKHRSIIILAGGDGLPLSSFYPTIPYPLLSIGHSPMLCILMSTLYDLRDKFDTVYIVVSEEDRQQVQIEMKRWFPSHFEYKILGTEEDMSAHALLDVLPEIQDSESFLLLQVNFPLISSLTMEHVMMDEHDFCVVGIHDPEHTLKNIHLSGDHQVTSISNEGSSEYGYIGCMKITRDLLEKSLVDKELYTDIISYENKPYLVTPYFSSYKKMDSICVRTSYDRTYAEHVYMERKHIDFLHQCYSLWNECKQLEKRIETMERYIKSDDCEDLNSTL